MESIIQTFHIDWKLVLAQIVNFGIVVGVLWFFALKPLVQKMSERTKTIEKSLEEAKEISEKMKRSDEERKFIIVEARKAAQKVLDTGQVQAKSEREKSIAETRSQVEKIVAEGKRQISLEKEKMIQEVRSDAGDLVALAAAKLLEKVVDKKIDRELVEETLKEMKR